MRFALIGDHPHGHALAAAVIDAPRHTLAAVVGAALPDLSPSVPRLSDLEEVLADPSVEAVIVASGPGERLAHLRRVLQSERPALALVPIDGKPDGGYEIAMLQGDTHQVLLPVMPLLLHPALDALRDEAAKLGPVAYVDLKLVGPAATETLDAASKRLSFPGWELLRRVGGELAEVSGYAEKETPEPGDRVFAFGRFQRGGLWRVSYFERETWINLSRLAVYGPWGGIQWYFDLATGDGRLTTAIEREIPNAGWPERLLERFVSAVERQPTLPRSAPGSPAPASDDRLGWPDAVRSLELDDALRRAIERRRATVMEYQEASEEVGFKGTMTLLGCGLMWAMLVLLVVATWLPGMKWVMAGVLVLFLGLQLLRWLVPSGPAKPAG